MVSDRAGIRSGRERAEGPGRYLREGDPGSILDQVFIVSISRGDMC